MLTLAILGAHPAGVVHQTFDGAGRRTPQEVQLGARALEFG